MATLGSLGLVVLRVQLTEPRSLPEMAQGVGDLSFYL